MRHFTVEEISEVIRSTQVLAPQFTEEQYRKLMELGLDLADSGLVEAAYELRQLTVQEGVPYTQAAKRYRALVKEKATAESQIKALRAEREQEQRLLGDTLQALKRAKEERGRAEAEMAAFKNWAAEEQERLKNEVAHAAKKARVDQEGIATAGRLKAEVERHGLTLELALKLMGEFAEHEDASMSLAEAVVQYGSAQEAQDVLDEENDALKSEVEQRQDECARLQGECQQHRDTLAQLRSDLEEEKARRGFWRRYHPWRGLLEYLATWDQVFLLRCGFALGGARFLTSRGPENFRASFVCPCCGVGQVYLDEQGYAALGIGPYRGPIKIHLEG